MATAILRFLADENGAAMIEYGLILGLLSIAGIIAFQAVGLSSSAMYFALAGRVQSVTDYVVPLVSP
jgi:Flp pilus assembly pilin Flp